jgi:DNA-directed RNA polymerase beta subunit
MTKEEHKKIEAILRKKASALHVDEDIFGDRNYVPVGVGGMIAATEKLLHVNQGVADPDDRDASQFKRLYTVPHLLRERIRLDADKSKRSLLRFSARTKSLKAARPFLFDGYMDGQLVGNPLTMPLEEINPMHILEQSRRITQMGPGGIGSEDSITGQMQAVKASEFGFIDPLAGPESSLAGVDVRASWGTKYGRDGRIYQRMKNRRTGKMEWVSPDDLKNKILKLPD